MPVVHKLLRLAALAALGLTTACISDSYGYAPDYPAGYDSGMGSGNFAQPGDLFGGRNVADVRVFHEPLAPYGVWTQSRFGYAFQPRVAAGWRPYVNGQWGENRLWLSNDPWGWATDHYGRWGHDPQLGWVWVPGTEWAPSWVAFREDPAQNVAGWAPVPPGVNYSINLGFGSGWGFDNFNSWYGPSWVWVPRPFLFQPGFGGRVLPWSYGNSYWRSSRWQYQPGWGGRPNWNAGGWNGGWNNGWNGGWNNGWNGGWNGNNGRRRNDAVPGQRDRQPGGRGREGFIPYQPVPRVVAGEAGAPDGPPRMRMGRGGGQQVAERRAGLPRAERQPTRDIGRAERAERAGGRGRDAGDNPYVRPD
jgi:hypothetical protein